MKKFDIQRFAKRRIQVGDNLQGRIIYTDTFSKEEVEEFANECGDWQNYYIVSSTAGQYKNGIHEQMVPNEAENKISSYKIDIAGQTIIQYDGTDITTQNNEISLVDYEYSILIDSIQRYNFNHEIVEDDGGKRYRKFYIEDAHVRPLVVGDEITIDTKFYFNIPDDIYNSLSGVTNPIVLSGSDGFKINCIGNGSDQTLIRFSNAMGSTEEANIYDMISGTLNTNKSMMQNVTTMDSNWVGTVSAADSTHPLYNMILVDETTLGNYVEPIELPSTVRAVRLGDIVTDNTMFYFTFPNNFYSEESDGEDDVIVIRENENEFQWEIEIDKYENNNVLWNYYHFNSGGGGNRTNNSIYYYTDSGRLTNINQKKASDMVVNSSYAGTVYCRGMVVAIDEDNIAYKHILVDETTLGNSERSINIRRVKIGDNLRNKKIHLDISNLDNSYFSYNFLQQTGVPRDIIKCGNISLLQEYPIETNDDDYDSYFSLTLLDNTVTLCKAGSNNAYADSSWYLTEWQLEYQMPDDKDYIITETIDYLSDTEDYASLLCFYIEDNNIRSVQSGDIIDENTKTYINFPYKYSKEWSQEQSFNFIMNTEEEDNKIVMTFNYENNLLSIRDENTLPIYGTGANVNRDKSLPIGTVVGFSIEEVPYNANNYILVDTTTLGKIPTTSMGSASYKNGGNWNKLLSLAQEQVPLKGSIIPGPIKWSAVNSTAECTDSKTLYFVFGEEEASPTYETLTAQAKGATYGDSIFGGSGSHTLVVKNSDDEQNEYPYTVSLNGSGFYTDLEFSVVTNKPFQLGITFSYGLDPSMSSNQVSLGATLLDLISYESFSFNTVVTGTEGVGQTYWFPTTNSSGTQLTFDWLKNANLRITSSVSEYGQACLSGDTKIKTLNNDIYISDLELGDKVIDKDNQETEITKIYNHKIDTVYQIHLDNDETIECSYDHKFLVDGGKATTAAQLKENDKLGQYTITFIDIINKELDVYEIKTESNTYTLANGIICECENI